MTIFDINQVQKQWQRQTLGQRKKQIPPLRCGMTSKKMTGNGKCQCGGPSAALLTV
jgi:hypothetical protein